MADRKLSTMNVRARETFWERHPQHPDGEVFIAKDEEGIVAETPEALQALGRGKLLRLSGGDDAAKEMEQRAAGEGAVPPKKTPSKEATANAIPEDFPGASLLTGAGYKSTEEVDDASDEELLQISGLGQATLVKIREALG